MSCEHQSHPNKALLFMILIISHHYSDTYGAAVRSRTYRYRFRTTTEKPSTELNLTTPTIALTTPTLTETTSSIPSPSTTPSPISDRQLRQNRSTLSFSSEANHQHTLDRQNEIIDWAQSLSLAITQTLTRPITFINNHLSQAAGALPSVFATNGAALGTAIATPIQLGTLTANNLLTGITGTLISVPISVVSGGTAQALGAYESGRQLYRTQMASLGSTMRQYVPTWLRPIALVGGANSVLNGIGMSAVGTGMSTVGEQMQTIGDTMMGTGEDMQGLGGTLYQWNNDTELLVLVPAAPADAPTTPPVPTTTTEISTETTTTETITTPETPIELSSSNTNSTIES